MGKNKNFVKGVAQQFPTFFFRPSTRLSRGKFMGPLAL
jgi:hypothetical protein